MQRSVRLVEGGWIQMRNQPINIMVGSRCVCSLSVGILRLMSPPLRVGANIHFDTAYFPTPHLLITLVKIGGQVETVLGPVALYDQGVHPITDIVRI